MATVLSVGCDRLLMKIRTLVLRKAGYRVFEAYCVRDALVLAASWQLDLVLICHTVTEREQKELIGVMDILRPGLPVLCISSQKHYAENEECSLVDNCAPAFLIEINATLQKTGTLRGSQSSSD
jgi:DNA-binding response OmpR family regulator